MCAEKKIKIQNNLPQGIKEIFAQSKNIYTRNSDSGSIYIWLCRRKKRGHQKNID